MIDSPRMGQPVEATLWVLKYRHLKPKPEDGSEPADGERFVFGDVNVLTADPSGSDLFAVARDAVMGVGKPAQDFSIVYAQRLCDSVKGLAIVTAEASKASN